MSTRLAALQAKDLQPIAVGPEGVGRLFGWGTVTTRRNIAEWEHAGFLAHAGNGHGARWLIEDLMAAHRLAAAENMKQV